MSDEDKSSIVGHGYTGQLVYTATSASPLTSNLIPGPWAKISPQGDVLEFDEDALRRNAEAGEALAIMAAKLIDRTRKLVKEETDFEVIGYGYKHPDSDLIVQYEENPFVSAVDRGLDDNPSVPLCDYNKAMDDLVRLKLYAAFVDAENDYLRAALAEARGEV